MAVYYRRDSDVFVCTVCGVCLRATEDNDDPETLHQRLPVACDRSPAVGRPYIPPSSPIFRLAERCSGLRLTPHIVYHPTSSQEIEDYLTQPMVQYLVNDVGFKSDLVRQVITRQLETTGNCFRRTEDLVATVFKELNLDSNDIEGLDAVVDLHDMGPLQLAS